MKELLVYHVAPDKSFERWNVIREGKKAPKAKGLSKSEAVEVAKNLLQKKACAGLLLVHKTRYIIEEHLRFS